MLGFLEGRRAVLTITASVGVGIGAVGAWYVAPSGVPPPGSTATEVAAAAQQAPRASAGKPSADPLPGASARPAPAANAPPATPPSSAAADATTATPDAAAPAPQRPEFDIVRVERSGDSVIAGRGAPGATIALVEGATTLASAVAGPSGEIVFLPPKLAPGEHILTLRQSIQDSAQQVVSSQSVTVLVPGASKGSPVVALMTPGQPTAILSDGSAPKADPRGAPAASAPAASVPAIAIRTAEAEEGGSFFATGIAPPGSQSRFYLNGAFLGKVVADLHGFWSLKVEKGMRPGNYVIRADEVEPESGKVLARAEVPFNFPATIIPSPEAVPANRPATPGAPVVSGDHGLPASPVAVAAGAPASAATVIKEVRTATVVRGDSLWRISRKMLGRGIRYTQIYEVNANQIRNPRLVFPGQIFVVPSDPS